MKRVQGTGYRVQSTDFKRFHRVRTNSILRSMISETQLKAEQLVMPFFVKEGSGKEPIASMPGQYRLPVKELVKEVRRCRDLGIRAVLLFGIPGKKDSLGSEAYRDTGIVQQAVQVIKSSAKEIVVITDVCLCEYMVHGHCGVIKESGQRTADSGQKNRVQNSKFKIRNPKLTEVVIDNDATLELLAKTALSHVQAGADIVAPSSMMDGQVAAIRHCLDQKGYKEIPILAYSAKFASAFYGPFREAAGSAPQFGNRRGYQMDTANAKEALREVAADIEEGADIVMVKPALAYLDILWRVKEKFGMPTAAFCVSGEYAMVSAALQKGWLSHEVIREILLSIHRAGADIIVTYWAMKVAEWMIK